MMKSRGEGVEQTNRSRALYLRVVEVNGSRWLFLRLGKVSEELQEVSQVSRATGLPTSLKYSGFSSAVSTKTPITK